MSISRIILCIVIVTYRANASILSARSFDDLSPFYDTPGEYNEDNPLAEADTVDTETDYEETDWEHTNEITGRQLPTSGEVTFNQDKKSQIWCKAKKVIRHHSEPGYEFYPKSYNEYDCVAHTSADGVSENSFYSSDICQVHHGRCMPIQKKHHYMKKRKSERCWKVERTTVKDICPVKDVRCRSLQKTIVFFKWPITTKPFCGVSKVEKTVNVGCNCIHHLKFHY